MKITLYIAASVDGYIAGPNGEIDWLSMVDRPGEDYGYYQFYNSADALIMGRKTYDLAVGFGEWPYSGKQSFVFTRQPLTTDREDVTFVSSSPQELVADLEAKGFQHIWMVGGGEVIRAFMDHGLIDEHIISFIPVLLGEGIPMFPPPNPQQQLELVSSKQYDSGLVQVHYKSIP